MKEVGLKLLRIIRITLFAVLVGYMIAWHNVYKEDQKLAVDIAITVEDDTQVNDTAPK